MSGKLLHAYITCTYQLAVLFKSRLATTPSLVAEYFDLVCNCGLDDIKLSRGDEGDMIHVASLSYQLLAELALVNLAGVA